jgi:hypothetical protein
MRGEEYNDSLSRVKPGAFKLGIKCYTNLRNMVLSLFGDGAKDVKMTAMFHNKEKNNKAIPVHDERIRGE